MTYEQTKSIVQFDENYPIAFIGLTLRNETGTIEKVFASCQVPTTVNPDHHSSWYISVLVTSTNLTRSGVKTHLFFFRQTQKKELGYPETDSLLSHLEMAV